ncbi:hypothetical protein PHSY_004075 [Pseudozyma hubeiensis SY62]|uniref:t-SNARE affecting a late Golgi compartment protein 1 n=1 Tax=Pseudozyma hubeiensis (strain SY62) TaxID=1305764 RepID=R9PEH1_PSEHS|nr:hypothetical protein PHSY_004075 [Pseudozyma hubeiensis SY62]GAC96495.1 hypothetical protein PHSY_004075 [Pseudozyma hubeiensis SY62]
MSRDPYHDFASDLKSSLSSARSLSQSYRQLVSRSQAHASSSSSATNSGDVESAHDRLSDAIEGLRQDVEDVKQSVLVVERSGPERFGVSPEELRSRKAFVAECEAEVKALSQVVKSSPPGGRDRFDSVKIDLDDADEDATEAFEREQQQMLMSRQDSTLDKIGSTLSSLRNQAGMMGQEIGEQIEIIDAFDSEVDQSQGRLGKAMSKMDEVVRISDERLGGCHTHFDCIPHVTSPVAKGKTSSVIRDESSRMSKQSENIKDRVRRFGVARLHKDSLQLLQTNVRLRNNVYSLSLTTTSPTTRQLLTTL